jgi:superfamily I DNA and/or RNA helicase
LFIETGASPAAKHHVDEARLVVLLVQAIRHIQPQLSIGVLSPWRAQNRQIVLELQALGIPCSDEEGAVKVDTIERFQGAERDIILFSTALSEPRYLRAMQSVIGRPGLPEPYINVDRKMVVALSRAREQVILFGHAPFLEPDIHYGTLLEVIKRRGSFVPRQMVEVALDLLP